MILDKKIAVVIPCYRVAQHIYEVIIHLPSFVDNIIVVDDKCPQQSGKLVESLSLSKVVVVYHYENQGVGGAVISGYKKALELSSDIIVKVDGDGQMNPDHMQQLIEPLIQNKADYTKGNRFRDFKALKSMPNVRLFGNSMLSFLVKISSGYWNIMDPTNGYTAITKEGIEELNFNNISKRYFFEFDMLINLNIESKVVKDVSMPALYGDEVSSLSIKKVLYEFPPKILKGFMKRVFYKYFIYNFNMASIYLLLGIPLFLFGVFFGSYRWYIAIVENIENSTGTIMLAVLPIILGIQFLLQAIQIDINDIPKKD